MSAECSFRCCHMVCVCVTDSQVVPYLLWFAIMGSVPPRVPCDFTTSSPSNSPCGPTRDILLHYYWLAQLASWKNLFLADARVDNRTSDWVSAKGWWYEMGSETSMRLSKCRAPLYKPVIFTRVHYFILQVPVNWKDKIANPFFPECCQNFTEQLWIESRLIFLLWNVFKMLIYTSRLNNHYHIVTIYNEPLCNVNTSIEGMYKYDTFRDQRVRIYFHFNYSFIADMEQCCHAAETHIPDEFKSERKLMCQLFTHKWNTLLHVIWSFLYTFLINWIFLWNCDMSRNEMPSEITFSSAGLFSCQFLCIHNSVHENAKTMYVMKMWERDDDALRRYPS